jgi:Holliday junction resolvase RusA-like endonuclease
MKKPMYNLFIPGLPKAQPRTRKGKYGNIYNPKTADNWKETIQVYFLAAGLKDTILRPVCLSLYLYFYAPVKSHKAGPHTIKPDGDNLLKSVMDALKNIGVYKDDCQVFLKTVGKFWTNDKEKEGMKIWVSEVV